MNADIRNQNQVEKIEGKKVTQNETGNPYKRKDGNKSISTWEHETMLSPSDIPDHGESNLATDKEEPLFLPKKPRLPPKKALKSVFKVGKKIGSDDSDDRPLFISSPDSSKRKAPQSPSSANITNSPSTVYPSKRQALGNAEITNKETSVNQATKSNRNGGLNMLALSSSTCVEDTQHSKQIDQAKQLSNPLESANLSQVDSKLSLWIEPVATSSIQKADTPLITLPQTSVNVNEDCFHQTQVSNENDKFPSNASITPLAIPESSSSSTLEANRVQSTASVKVGIGMDMDMDIDSNHHTSNDVKSLDSLTQLISRNSQKNMASRSLRHGSRISGEFSDKHRRHSRTQSSPTSLLKKDGQNGWNRRTTSSGSTLPRDIAIVQSQSQASRASNQPYIVSPQPPPPSQSYQVLSTVTRINLPPHAQDSSIVWNGKVRWGNYSLLDVNLKSLNRTAIVEEIQATISHQYEMCLNSYFSQQHLADYISSPPEMFVLSFPIDSVPYGKLRNLLSINNSAGLIRLSLRYSFAVVPYTFPLVRKEDIDVSHKTSLFFIHIALPCLYPNIPSYHIDSRRNQGFDVSSVYEWHMIMRMYAMPSQIMSVPMDKSILIIDDHPEVDKIRYTAYNYGYKIANRPIDPTLHTVLIHCRDFPHKTIPKLEEMKRPGIHFLLFGYPDLTASMISGTEVFPERSGGYVTISVEEFVSKPEVLKDMIQSVEELNNYMESTISTRWQIIFPDDIFDQITKAGGKDRERMDQAKWELMNALEEDNVYILARLVKAKDTTNKWMDRVAQSFASKRRYFVQVTSMKLDNPSHRVSTVDPQDLQSRFKPMTSIGSIP